jgi:hypothetical protein
MPVAKLKVSSSLLTPTRRYVENNIKKRMALITEAWEISKSMIYFGSRVHVFHDHLQVDLKNEEGFYLDVVVPFGVKFSNTTELRRREEDIPSPSQIKQLNMCWKEKIKKTCITLFKHATKPYQGGKNYSKVSWKWT